ncbi:Aminotransferase, DegT/DnrJ/EryC1/StrS family [hydrothermal vent metagenome]|uniref:Aminotransferase, DegT/DnrJ/EryC1/StrS family n=1 Tax=hydrothermal vent metagenome TaxID=652676 RepID=A0A3B1CPU5_9ZZZZ
MLRQDEKTKIMAYDKFIPYSLPLIEDEDIAAVLDTLRSGWITTGPKTKEFETEFAKYIGCKHAIAVNSCTAALHLALDAIGIKEGDEVITSPMTFAATAEVIRYFKAKPVFVDIDPLTMNIDVKEIERYLSTIDNHQSSQPKAIIPVHYTGYPCDMDSIRTLAGKYGLKVIEDAAHALPAYFKGKIVGSTGDITCFSFYATKNITTGEGGMVTTNNVEWAERMRIMSLHGISKDAWNRYSAEGSWYYEIIAPGYKYNLTDIAASLGIVQIGKADRLWMRRYDIARMYNESFQDIKEIELPFNDEDMTTVFQTPNLVNSKHSNPHTRHSWHLYVIRLNLEGLTIDRSRFIEELKAMGIGTSVHFIPLHLHPYYRDTYGYKPEDFPVAYETFKRIISLPIYPKMTDGDVERVVEAVVSVIKKFRR